MTKKKKATVHCPTLRILLRSRTAPGKGRSLRERGFTLVEVLVVAAILGVLVLLALTSFTYISNTAKVARCSEEIRSIEKQIVAYATEKGSLPDNLDQVGMVNQRDPWGHNYRYLLLPGPTQDPSDPIAGQRTNVGACVSNDFDLYSVGPNNDSSDDVMALNSKDDVIRAGNGGYIGLAEKLNDLGL